MKLIIAGGRDYELRDDHKMIILALLYHTTEVVSGKCPTGGDKVGEDIAKECKVPVKPFPADWGRYGSISAGVIRNKQMAEYADAVLLLPGNKGTNDMFAQALHHKLKIYDLRYS